MCRGCSAHACAADSSARAACLVVMSLYVRVSDVM